MKSYKQHWIDIGFSRGLEEMRCRVKEIIDSKHRADYPYGKNTERDILLEEVKTEMNKSQHENI